MGLFSFLKKEQKVVKPEVKPIVKPTPTPPVKQNTSTFLTESDVLKITDQNRLWEIIKGKYGWDITKAAASQLEDQKPLMEYMKTLTAYSDQQKRGAIINGITDQNLLAEIASKEKEYRLRQSAMKRITDKKILMDALVKYHYQSSEVDTLLKKLNKDELAYIIDNSKSSSTVEKALMMIGDQMKMAEYMIGKDTDSLINLIDDKPALEKIAEEAAGQKLRSKAVKKLGGYICTECGKLNPPDENLTCTCRFCGAENHDYVHISNVQEYRDYEVGTTYDECTRCGKQINIRHINTM
ncbi:MAG: hypothetical protein IJM15_01665 [Erysipelotrichaceae bacterium]|nr:hypothetical protein [Erysipelotrichaceae bacterium]